MQAQDNTIDDFSGTFYLEYGSSGINHQSDQNNVVLDDALIADGNPVVGWTGQSSAAVNSQTLVRFQDLLAEDGLLSNVVDQSASSSSTQSPVRFQDLLAEDGLLASAVTGAGTDESSVERHPEPMIAPSQNSINITVGNGELTNRQFPLQQGSSSALPQNINLNAVCESHAIDANPNTRMGNRPDAVQNPFAGASSSSSSLVISSGVAGYVVEEHEGGESRILNGRRVSCKRRAPEDASEELLVGESSRSTQQAVNNQISANRRLNISTPVNNHPEGVYSQQLGPGTVLGLEAPCVVGQPSSAAGGMSVMRQNLGVTGEAESSQRNIRLRRTANQQDLMPANFAAWAATNSQAQVLGQPAVLFPFNHVPNTTLLTIQPTPTIIHPTTSNLSVSATNFSETLQPVQWNTVNRSRAVLPSNAYNVNGGESFLLNENSSNNTRNLMLPPEFQRGTLEHMSTNLNSIAGTNSFGSIASSSRNNSIAHVQHSMHPPLVIPQTNMAEQYAHRISNIINQSETQGQGSYCPQHLGFPVDPRQRNAFARIASSRPALIPFRSLPTGLAGRQTGTHPEFAFRSMVAAQRRSRLVSEVHNALALVRRGGSLQFEDVMVIDRSVLFGVPEEPDLHEDMRLDVDDMSYEELLALGERIGHVSTGLTEDAIQANMKRRKYQAIIKEPPSEVEPCCICQEDYADGEDLGKLDCGHDFHFNCIKQWLLQKNNCPICKMTGLAV